MPNRDTTSAGSSAECASKILSNKVMKGPGGAANIRMGKAVNLPPVQCQMRCLLIPHYQDIKTSSSAQAPGYVSPH